MQELYDHGEAFDKVLAENLDEQSKDRVGKDFPSLLLIDGGQGQGKTTLMTHVIDYVNKINGLPPASLKISEHPQVSMGGKEFIKHFNICRKQGLPIIGYDEAGDFSKRGSLTRFNAMLNRRFETIRSSNIIVVFCLPNFNVIDNNLFELQVIRGLLHLHSREITGNYGNYDAYSAYQMGWIRHWFDKLPKPRKHTCYDKSYPNFMGHFKNLDPVRVA